MGQVISFDDYLPAARFDAVPWTQAQIEEAATAAGTWTVIDTIALSPADPDPASPALRSFTTDAGTAPNLWYRVTFLDANADSSQPTDPVHNVESEGNLYVTRDELKTILGLQATEFADVAIDIAIDSASRVIDGYKGTRFYPTAETRYYTASGSVERFRQTPSLSYFPPGAADASLLIDDLVTLETLTVDTDGDGIYETTWVEGTDFVLDPANASLDGRPTRYLVLLSQARRAFPNFNRAIKVEGTFGWATTPALVKQAAVLLANRFLTRTRSAPLGILVATAQDTVATARLGRIDPDAAFLLDHIPNSQPALVSLQLG